MPQTVKHRVTFEFSILTIQVQFFLANSLVSVFKIYAEPDLFSFPPLLPSHTISHLVYCDTLLPDSAHSPVQSVLNPEPIVIQLKQNKRSSHFSAQNLPMASISLQAKLQSFQLSCSPSFSDFLSYYFPLLAPSVPASESLYPPFLLPGMLFSQMSTRLILSLPI